MVVLGHRVIEKEQVVALGQRVIVVVNMLVIAKEQLVVLVHADTEKEK